MPCRGPESDTFTRGDMEREIDGAVKRTRDEMGDAKYQSMKYLESHAEMLRIWLEVELDLKGDDSETARLCALIRSVGEDYFLNFLAKRVIDCPEARMLLGWWEEHKRIDVMEGR